MRGIVICVDYDDLLAITLVSNMRFFSECLVVTHPRDERTKAVAAAVPGARVLETDAFYRDGAKFNKGAAMEEGFDALLGSNRGIDDWVLVWDADIQLPREMPLIHGGLRPDTLYSANRLILEDPREWRPGFDWSRAKRTTESTFAGFFQLFYSNDQTTGLRERRPWYDPGFAHAGGCDHYFQSLWPVNRKQSLPINVLHLGPRDRNWYGRTTLRLDGAPPPCGPEDMQRLVRARGWDGRQPSGEHVMERIS